MRSYKSAARPSSLLPLMLTSLSVLVALLQTYFVFSTESRKVDLLMPHGHRYHYCFCCYCCCSVVLRFYQWRLSFGALDHPGTSIRFLYDLSKEAVDVHWSCQTQIDPLPEGLHCENHVELPTPCKASLKHCVGHNARSRFSSSMNCDMLKRRYKYCHTLSTLPIWSSWNASKSIAIHKCSLSLAC